jgi:hypothetical protein
VRVVVTADDILRGCKLSPSHCPIAIAVKRVFPGELVSVSQISIVVGSKAWPTPKIASHFIASFDWSRSAVQPTYFELEDK